MGNRFFRNLLVFFSFAALILWVCVPKVHAQASALQNLQAPGFICAGQPVTITFQAEVAVSNLKAYVGGAFSPVGENSFSSTTDYLFMYTGDTGSPVYAPGAWPAELDNAFSPAPAGDLSMVTYTCVTTVPASFTTGEAVWINISASSNSDWSTDLNMTSDLHLSLPVTVNCNDKALDNTAQFGGSSSTAPLVIIGGVTNTFTATPSNTATSTPTASFTGTDTNTATSTYTDTSTPTTGNTATSTFTTTPTNTPTLTATATDTATPADTPSSTFTATPTDTPVPSASPTLTFTVTATSTPSSTPTVTPTSTFTDTPVPSASPTLTFTVTTTSTPSATPTNTMTYTITSTPAGVGVIGKTASETSVNAGDNVTYTISVTVTGSGLANPVVTDDLPPDMTFAGFVSAPAGTASSSSGANSVLQWILPSPIGPGVYDLKYQVKVNSFAPANVPLVNNARLGYTGGGPVTAAAPVTVIGNFTVSVNIYNSAGEVVKTIPVQGFSTAVNNIVLSATNMITALTGAGSTIEILFNGYVLGTWDGTDNQGQPVSNGSYTVQVDNISSSGTVTSVSQKAVVSRGLSGVEVDVFNEAGEEVRKLYGVVDNPTSSSMTNVTLSASALRPDTDNAASGSAGAQVQILVQDTDKPVTLAWDGTNDSGSFVTPGEYEIEVHWTNGSGSTTDITRTILVLPGEGVGGSAVARPNVLNAANGTTATFDVSGVANAAGMKVKIYTVAAELVRQLKASSLYADWNAGGLASGIYIADVEIDNAAGGVVGHQRLKILVIH